VNAEGDWVEELTPLTRYRQGVIPDVVYNKGVMNEDERRESFFLMSALDRQLGIIPRSFFGQQPNTKSFTERFRLPARDSLIPDPTDVKPVGWDEQRDGPWHARMVYDPSALPKLGEDLFILDPAVKTYPTWTKIMLMPYELMATFLTPTHLIGFKKALAYQILSHYLKESGLIAGQVTDAHVDTLITEASKVMIATQGKDGSSLIKLGMGVFRLNFEGPFSYLWRRTPSKDESGDVALLMEDAIRTTTIQLCRIALSGAFDLVQERGGTRSIYRPRGGGRILAEVCLVAPVAKARSSFPGYGGLGYAMWVDPPALLMAFINRTEGTRFMMGETRAYAKVRRPPTLMHIMASRPISVAKCADQANDLMNTCGFMGMFGDDFVVYDAMIREMIMAATMYCEDYPDKIGGVKDPLYFGIFTTRWAIVISRAVEGNMIAKKIGMNTWGVTMCTMRKSKFTTQESRQLYGQLYGDESSSASVGGSSMLGFMDAVSLPNL